MTKMIKGQAYIHDYYSKRVKERQFYVFILKDWKFKEYTQYGKNMYKMYVKGLYPNGVNAVGLFYMKRYYWDNFTKPISDKEALIWAL